MNGAHAYEMLMFCIRSMLLGGSVFIAYYLIRALIYRTIEAFRLLTGILKNNDHINLSAMIGGVFGKPLSLGVKHEAYNVVFTILVALVYSSHAYIFIDGEFRILPLCILVGTFIGLKVFLLPKLDRILSSLAAGISLVFLSPVALLLLCASSICRILSNACVFSRKK